MFRRAFRATPGVICFAVLGCSDDTVIVPSGQFGGDTGINDTGFIEYDVGSGLIEPGECLTNKKTGPGGNAVGYQYMCEGIFSGYFRYVFDNSYYLHAIPTSGDINFGFGHDQYPLPRIMACCGEYDDNQTFGDQPEFALNCIMDARDTACHTMIHVLAKEANALPNGDQKDAVWEMHDYIQSHLTECIAGLHGEAFPNPLVPEAHSATWTLPSTWQTQGLFGAELFYSVYVNDLWWPETDYPNLMETCTSLKKNNPTVFSDAPSPLTYATSMSLEEATGNLLGPTYEGARISAATDFASLTTSCDGGWCSHAAVSEESTGNWSLDEMMLFIDGSFAIGNGTISETLDIGYLELSGSASGTWLTVSGQDLYEVPVGNATFIAGGRIGENGSSLTAFNSTPITATQLAGEWIIESFDIEYMDPMLGTFTFTINESTWLED